MASTRPDDHLSSFTITVIYAIFAAGTITALLAETRVAARVGRRGVMLLAVAVMMAAAALLAAWKGLPVLIVARLLTGVAAGLAAGTAITYLIELRLRADPGASMVRARTIGTSINVGALGVGPLVAGCLAEWASWPLTLSYLVVLGLGAVAFVGLCFVPETGTPTPHATANQPRRRSPRLPVPAAAGTLAAFAASGLFAGLAGLILAVTLGRSSHALAGATLFLVFACGAASQVATIKLSAVACARTRHVFDAGRPRVPRGFRPPFLPEPRSLPGVGRVHRRRSRRGLQGDDRHRARSGRARGSTGHDVETACRALRRALHSGGWSGRRVRTKAQASPTRCSPSPSSLRSASTLSGWALLGRRPRASSLG